MRCNCHFFSFYINESCLKLSKVFLLEDLFFFFKNSKVFQINYEIILTSSSREKSISYIHNETLMNAFVMIDWKYKLIFCHKDKQKLGWNYYLNFNFLAFNLDANQTRILKMFIKILWRLYWKKRHMLFLKQK